jgi:hypothetical protein
MKVMVKDMAQKIVLVDDLDGVSDATHLLTFFVDGDEYEIDLNAENNAKYEEEIAAHRQMLQFLADHGRRVERQRKLAPKARTKADYDKIRDWARENGFPQVKDAGRIAEHILTAYDKRVVAPQKSAETTEEGSKGEGTPETVETVTESPKPVAVPAAEFSAELPPVVTTNAKNTSKPKAGVK